MPMKSSSIWKRIGAKLGLDIPLVLLMIKYVTLADLPHFRYGPVACAPQRGMRLHRTLHYRSSKL
jgi:hypothetical protein